MGNPILALNTRPAMDAKINSMMELPLMFRALNMPRVDQHGTTPVVADGILIPATPDLSLLHQGQVETPVSGSTGNSSSTNLINRLFLVPKHDALSVIGFNFAFAIGLSGSSVSGGIFYIDKVEAFLVKITAAGTETTLRTVTNTTGISLSQTSLTWFGLGVADDFAAISIANTERLGIRIKTWGRFSTTGFSMTHQWGGAYPSYFGLKIS